jgi:ABC-type multidrug transport system ATPase subunit
MTSVRATVRRGGHVVLYDSACDIAPNAITGLIGVNGAGKTTLMMHRAGVLAGSARTGDRVGYSPQRPVFPDWLDPTQIAELFGVSLDHLARRCSGLLLQELATARAGTLSAGQAQALSIALALAVDSSITLLDEPFAALDFRRRIGLAKCLREHAVNGRAVLIASQSAAELLDVCSWVLVLRAGHFVFAGPITELAGSGSAEARRAHLEESILSLIGTE